MLVDRIVTCDEKWTLYRKPSGQRFDVDELSQTFSNTKADVTKCFLISVVDSIGYCPLQIL